MTKPAVGRFIPRTASMSAAPRTSPGQASGASKESFQQQAQQHSSSFGQSGGGDQIALIDTIEDEGAPDPEVSLEQTEMREALAKNGAEPPPESGFRFCSTGR